MRKSRTPDWNGAFNLLDLGGLPLVGGGTTAYGRVFRSGRTDALTDQGWSGLRKAGVSTVIDLRNDAERVRHAGDAAVSNPDRSGVVFAFLATEDPDNAEFQEVCGPWLDHPRSYPDNLRLFPSKIGLVFTALANAPGSTLVHCSGGRDRTGLITAMLLQLNGVELTAIADDYAHAFRTASRHVARASELDPDSVHEQAYSHEEIEVRVAERTETLCAWLDGLNVTEWLYSAGLSEREIRAVQSRLLP